MEIETPGGIFSIHRQLKQCIISEKEIGYCCLREPVQKLNWRIMNGLVIIDFVPNYGIYVIV